MPKEDAASSQLPARGITKAFTFWQDREIRFDTTPDVFTMRPHTEEVLATFHHVEDSKGNNGQVGTLLVTNLRLLWWSAKYRTVNLSIGYYCVLNITVQETQSKLFGGTAEALFISSKFGSSRFMFVFTYVPKANDDVQGVTGARTVEGKTRLFAAAMAAWRAYDATKIYRELRLRGSIIANGSLILLADEHILSKVPNVTNVSKGSSHPGTLFTTNVRTVWYATSSESFNVSIPYMQLIAVRSQSTGFGLSLVLETSTYAGSFVLGFRVEPAERLGTLYQEIASLWKSWTAKPILGIRVSFNDADGDDDGAAAAAFNSEGGDSDTAMSSGGGKTENGARRHGGTRAMETVVIDQAPGDAFAAYYADEGQKAVDRKPVFDPSIGLAVEKLRKGITLKELWSVVV